MTPEALVTALGRPWMHGTHVDARGIEVAEPLDLNNMSLCNFDLSEARLRCGITACDTLFRGMAWLRGAEVTGACNFTGATFRSDLRLDGLICDRLVLDRVRCEGVLSLDGARVGELWLRDALGLANLSLAGTVVTRRADLSGSQIMGGIWAEGATLGEAAQAGLDVEGRRRGV